MNIWKYIFRELDKPTEEEKGNEGEFIVDAILNSDKFKDNKHEYLRNIFLVDENNNSHQIDHIEIRQNGIFCIETKNIKGHIIGGVDDEYWIQKLSGEQHAFYNPIKQNYGHIKCLNKVLGNKYKINSLIVMAENNANSINCQNVINVDDIMVYLFNYDDETHYSLDEMKTIYNKINSARSSISNREHIQNVKSSKH